MLCLWCRLAAAALIGPLAWELPYAKGAALKKGEKKKKKSRKDNILEADPISGKKHFLIPALIPALYIFIFSENL